MKEIYTHEMFMRYKENNSAADEAANYIAEGMTNAEIKTDAEEILDSYSFEVPEDKADFIKKEHGAGRKVILVGDGVNETPALSEAANLTYCR